MVKRKVSSKVVKKSPVKVYANGGKKKSGGNKKKPSTDALKVLADPLGSITSLAGGMVSRGARKGFELHKEALKKTGEVLTLPAKILSKTAKDAMTGIMTGGKGTGNVANKSTTGGSKKTTSTGSTKSKQTPGWEGDAIKPFKDALNKKKPVKKQRTNPKPETISLATRKAGSLDTGTTKEVIKANYPTKSDPKASANVSNLKQISALRKEIRTARKDNRKEGRVDKKVERLTKRLEKVKGVSSMKKGGTKC